jgi:hypothetical protein
MGPRVIVVALILLCISCAYAHDVIATPTAVCVNSNLAGWGPYISWSLWNDWPTVATLTLSVATSKGPAGTVLNFGPSTGASGTIAGILMPIKGGTTSIKGDAPL